MADAEAKRATKGQPSASTSLPKLLSKSLPHSISALHQNQKAKIQRKWLCHWKASPRYPKQQRIDSSTPSKKWLQFVANLTHAQASLIVQLHTGHISLNKHLHCIKCIDSPACPSCNTTPQETIQHSLFECNNYHQEHFMLQRKLGHNVSKPSYLLTNSSAIIPTLKYVHSMQCINQIFGKISSLPQSAHLNSC